MCVTIHVLYYRDAHRNTPKMFGPPSARHNFFKCTSPPNLKSWIRPCYILNLQSPIITWGLYSGVCIHFKKVHPSLNLVWGIHVIKLLCYNWRFANFWLEIWSHNWRFFIDIFDACFYCLLMFSFYLFQY